VSFPGFVIYMVYIMYKDNVASQHCNDAKVNPDGSIELGHSVYPNMAACVHSMEFWFKFGFTFYFILVLPCTIVYMEIFYYWMKALSPDSDVQSNSLNSSGTNNFSQS